MKAVTESTRERYVCPHLRAWPLQKAVTPILRASSVTSVMPSYSTSHLSRPVRRLLPYLRHACSAAFGFAFGFAFGLRLQLGFGL